MDALRRSLRQTLRSLGRRPGLATLIVATMALALAGNTALLCLLDGVLLEPLPFAAPRELVTLDVLSTKGFYISTSIPNLRDWRDRTRVFSAYAGSAGWNLILTGAGRAEVVAGRAVLGDLFGVLGIPARFGRVFEAAETEPGSEPLVVLGNGFWERRLGADPSIVGTALVLDGRPHTVLGVLPPRRGYPSAATDVYVNMGSLPDMPWDDRDSAFGTRAVARLAPGATLAGARLDLERVHREVEESLGGPSDRPEARTLADLFLGEARPRLWTLMAAVGCVLLIAIANVTHLLLARGEGRRQETGVRLALGAHRHALAAEPLAESLLLCLAGGALGLALAAGALAWIRPRLLAHFPAEIVERVGIDGSVLGATLGLALLAGLLTGLAPAWRCARAGLTAAPRGEGGTGGPGRDGLRSALVVTEMGLALVLLVGAGLLLRSLEALGRADQGYQAADVLVARVAAPGERHPGPEGWKAFYTALEERAGALPGVRSAAVSLLAPLTNRSWELEIHPEGASLEETGDSVLFGIVTEGYFDALGVPILQGRAFEDGDREGALPVAVIDETMARRFWPGADPLGKRVTLGDETAEDGSPLFRTVVGVAPNVRHYALHSPSRIQVYMPLRQTSRSGMGLYLLLRTSVPAASLQPALEREVAALDPEAPLYDVRTLDSLVDEAMAPSRAMGGVLAGFGGLSLLLAALGVFGVLSFFVAQRQREIGIRVALGADGRRIRTWVALRVARLTGLGVGLGLVAAAGLSRALAAFLYETPPVDAPTYGAVAATLFGVALLAAYLPARRAARVDPLTALRSGG